MKVLPVVYNIFKNQTGKNKPKLEINKLFLNAINQIGLKLQ